MSNSAQFPEVAKVCQDFRAMGAKVVYVRNAKGEEKGKAVDLNLGENLLEFVKK
jgi:hypothetical protein